jgi:hypothetical protein
MKGTLSLVALALVLALALASCGGGSSGGGGGGSGSADGTKGGVIKTVAIKTPEPSLRCVHNNATRGVEPLPERPDVPDLQPLILRLESVEQAPAVLLHVSIYPHHQSGLSPLA